MSENCGYSTEEWTLCSYVGTKLWIWEAEAEKSVCSSGVVGGKEEGEGSGAIANEDEEEVGQSGSHRRG